MAVINSIAAMADDLKAWRRHLHQHPELGLECHQTAAFVVEKLREFGITEISEGWATSGVVAIIDGKGPGRTIGLRADMDALPMDEISGVPYSSTVPGKMHACGHDGHTTMLLGAAKYLAETRNFSGRVALLFQPAEEGEGGGRIMVEEGVMETFGIDEVYGIHNAPSEAVGHILTNPGALLAAADTFQIEVQGQGGHGAMPHEARDPIMTAISIVQALQTIVTRNLDPLDSLVISVTTIHSGTAENIIPNSAQIGATVRFFKPEVQELVIKRVTEIAEGQAASFGMTAKVTYEKGYPPTINDAGRAAFASEIAREVVGEDKVNANTPPIMGAEDFAYMLNARPGAYVFLGQGDTPVCHHPAYDFNDEIAPVGASFFARLIEKALPVDAAS